MGLLRTLLALAVVVGHAGRVFGYQPIEPARAVQAFYIISGFYMALVLSTKYRLDWPGVKLFWQNRYLRLAPTYWVVLVLTVLGVVVLGRRKEQFEILARLDWPSLATVIVTNVTIFGQDAMMFLGLDPAAGERAFRFATSLQATPFPAARLLFVPQAWTLGVELLFYVCVPILARQRSLVLVALGLGSVGLRGLIYARGLEHDPWTYRFFPTELVFFLVGMLSYRAYRHFRLERVPRAGKQAALVIVLALSSTVEMTGPARTVLYPLLFVLLATTLPLLFDLTRRSKWDAELGELSYPVYIGHFIFVPFAAHAGRASGLAAAVMAVLFALVLVRVVERPIDRLRQARAKRAEQAAALASVGPG